MLELWFECERLCNVSYALWRLVQAVAWKSLFFHGVVLQAIVSVTKTKTTKFTWFPNQDKNKGKPSSKFKLWNKKNKNKNTTCVKQDSNKILLQEGNKNKTRLWQKKIPKLVLNILKVMGNSTFIYTYWAHNSNNFFKKTSNLNVAHVHSCVTHVWIKNQLWVN